MLPKDYGVLEQLPPELRYLKEVAWDGAQLPQYDLTDDNPEYSDKVYATVLENFSGGSQSDAIAEVSLHRQMIWDWLETDSTASALKQELFISSMVSSLFHMLYSKGHPPNKC